MKVISNMNFIFCVGNLLLCRFKEIFSDVIDDAFWVLLFCLQSEA